MNQMLSFDLKNYIISLSEKLNDSFEDEGLYLWNMYIIW